MAQNEIDTAISEQQTDSAPPPGEAGPDQPPKGQPSEPAAEENPAETNKKPMVFLKLSTKKNRVFKIAQKTEDAENATAEGQAAAQGAQDAADEGAPSSAMATAEPPAKEEERAVPVFQKREKKQALDVAMKGSIPMKVFAHAESAITGAKDASSGLIGLLNAVKEIQEGKAYTTGKRYGSGPRGGDGNRQGGLEFHAIENEAYRTAKAKETVGYWDENSAGAFNMKIGQFLNRVTERTATPSAAAELESFVHKYDECREYFLTSIMTKATGEKAFVNTYAKILSLIPDKSIVSQVANRATESLNDETLNEAENDIAAERSVGSASFVGALYHHRVLDFSTVQKAFDELVEKFCEDATLIQYNDMLQGFLKNAGKPFVTELLREGNSSIDKLRETYAEKVNTYTKLAKFKYIDLLEQLDELVGNRRKPVEHKATPDEEAEMAGKVRNAYCDFNEGTKIEYPKEITKRIHWLSSSLTLLPTFIKELPAYSDFMLESAKQMRLKAQDVRKVFIGCIGAAIKNKETDDTPQYWVILTTIMAQFAINGMLAERDCKELLRSISADTAPFSEVMKWYLFDTHMFDDAPTCRPKIDSKEVCYALHVPNLIKDSKPLPKSKLIACAIIKSVFSRLDRDEKLSLDGVRQYRHHLRSALEYRRTFEAVFGIMDEVYEPPFNLEELIGCISQ